jgi:hypothetical protein
MSRREFTKKTQREAWGRSGGQCEAVGAMYGLPENQRCGAVLNKGVEYDHVDCDANSKDNSLANCAAVCPKCHRWKTNHHDRPLIAKTNHQQDGTRNIRDPRHRPMMGSRKSGWRRRMDGSVERRP